MEIINNSTSNAKVDMVSKPDSIKDYSPSRDDYTELALIAIKQKPEVIKFLDYWKDFYVEACKIALSIDGRLIEYIYYPNMEEDLDTFFELVNIEVKKYQKELDDEYELLSEQYKGGCHLAFLDGYKIIITKPDYTSICPIKMKTRKK